MLCLSPSPTTPHSISEVPLARFVMMSTENDTTTFQFHSPQTGSYLLDIFAAIYPTFEQGRPNSRLLQMGTALIWSSATSHNYSAPFGAAHGSFKMCAKFSDFSTASPFVPIWI